MYVHGILSSLGTVDFDGAALIGTACPHAVPQKIPNVEANPLSLERD